MLKCSAFGASATIPRSKDGFKGGRETALAPRKLRLLPGMANLPLGLLIGRGRAGLERRLRYLGAGRADVAQLVEHQLPKLRVAGSSPVVRSSKALQTKPVGGPGGRKPAS